MSSQLLMLILNLRTEANHLDGTIPAEIRLLESLGFLCMGEQNLTGTIPALPASLTTLKLGKFIPS